MLERDVIVSMNVVWRVEYDGFCADVKFNNPNFCYTQLIKDISELPSVMKNALVSYKKLNIILKDKNDQSPSS